MNLSQNYAQESAVKTRTLIGLNHQNQAIEVETS
jgi:hypothetical protein